MKTIDLYHRVLKVVNFFLQNAGHLTVDALKEFNPSVAELAKDLRLLTNMLQGIASTSYDDQNQFINALQCCIVMTRIANLVASEGGQQSDLEEMFRELEKLTDLH